jgi:hypothetical protein
MKWILRIHLFTSSSTAFFIRDNLKQYATCSSETSVVFLFFDMALYPEDDAMCSDHRGNLKWRNACHSLSSSLGHCDSNQVQCWYYLLSTSQCFMVTGLSATCLQINSRSRWWNIEEKSRCPDNNLYTKIIECVVSDVRILCLLVPVLGNPQFRRWPGWLLHRIDNPSHAVLSTLFYCKVLSSGPGTNAIPTAPYPHQKEARYNSMEKSPWEANSRSASQEISLLLWTRKFVTVFMRVRHWSLFWTRGIYSIPPTLLP